jgi:hypothetical protein
VCGGCRGVVAFGPVAVPVGGDSPLDCVVLAGAQLPEQVRVELIVALGLGGSDRGGGLAQHGDVCGP